MDNRFDFFNLEADFTAKISHVTRSVKPSAIIRVTAERTPDAACEFPHASTIHDAEDC